MKTVQLAGMKTEPRENGMNVFCTSSGVFEMSEDNRRPQIEYRRRQWHEVLLRNNTLLVLFPVSLHN